MNCIIRPSLGSGTNKKYLKVGQRTSGTARDITKETMNLFLKIRLLFMFTQL